MEIKRSWKHFIIGIIFCSGGSLCFCQKDSVFKDSFIAVKLNPIKILSNEITLSIEYRRKKNAFEIEQGYLFPAYTSDSGNSFNNNFTELAIIGMGYPLFYHGGFSENLFYKRYSKKHFYYGTSFLYRYMFFNDKWVWLGGGNGGDPGNDYPNVFCSQKKDVFGISFRFGFLITIHKLIIEPYFGLGARWIKVQTNYHYYQIGAYTPSGWQTIQGKPENYQVPLDNGNYFFPYINFGVKVGLRWFCKVE